MERCTWVAMHAGPKVLRDLDKPRVGFPLRGSDDFLKQVRGLVEARVGAWAGWAAAADGGWWVQRVCVCLPAGPPLPASQAGPAAAAGAASRSRMDVLCPACDLPVCTGAEALCMFPHAFWQHH